MLSERIIIIALHNINHHKSTNNIIINFGCKKLKIHELFMANY